MKLKSTQLLASITSDYPFIEAKSLKNSSDKELIKF